MWVGVAEALRVGGTEGWKKTHIKSSIYLSRRANK